MILEPSGALENNQQLYEFIEVLKNELRRLEQPRCADSLDTAMYISSVGTEVFMALREELIRLQDSEINFSPVVRHQISVGVRYIGRALR